MAAFQKYKALLVSEFTSEEAKVFIENLDERLILVTRETSGAFEIRKNTTVEDLIAKLNRHVGKKIVCITNNHTDYDYAFILSSIETIEKSYDRFRSDVSRFIKDYCVYVELLAEYNSGKYKLGIQKAQEKITSEGWSDGNIRFLEHANRLERRAVERINDLVNNINQVSTKKYPTIQ
jgi:hypothetical protein